MLAQVAKVSQGPSLHLSGYRVMKLTKILQKVSIRQPRVPAKGSDGIVGALGPAVEPTRQSPGVHWAMRSGSGWEVVMTSIRRSGALENGLDRTRHEDPPWTNEGEVDGATGHEHPHVIVRDPQPAAGRRCRAAAGTRGQGRAIPRTCL